MMIIDVRTGEYGSCTCIDLVWYVTGYRYTSYRDGVEIKLFQPDEHDFESGTRLMRIVVDGSILLPAPTVVRAVRTRMALDMDGRLRDRCG